MAMIDITAYIDSYESGVVLYMLSGVVLYMLSSNDVQWARYQQIEWLYNEKLAYKVGM